MAEKKPTILRVKDLRISFRTVSGKVQAVRGISFDLRQGETLAIVGESGSGKSVTNRAVMGITAKNGIIESGEILYDGKDLLKIAEEDFHYIRGDKIAMIFQDPLSSLNPIIRIGRQLTEATLLKNRSNRHENAVVYKSMTEALLAHANAAYGDDANEVAENKKLINDFRALGTAYTKLQGPYSDASTALQDAHDDIEDLIFNVEKHVDFDLPELLSEFLNRFKKSVHPYILKDEAKVDELVGRIEGLKPEYRKAKGKHPEIYLPVFHECKAVIDPALDLVKPDNFAFAYCQLFVNEPLPEADVATQNEFANKHLEQDFMVTFNQRVAKALKHAHDESIEAMKEVQRLFAEKRPVFTKPELDKGECKLAFKELQAAVKKSINPLLLSKDSYFYTFGPSLETQIATYFRQSKINVKEQARYAKQKAKYDEKVAAGKTPGWKPVPANVLPHDLLVKNITDVIDNLNVRLQMNIDAANEYDAVEEAKKIAPYLREKAALSVYEVTRSMAKNMAVKLMKEVGIPEPRRRYRQYPFEFSGGMRQRIVIAIALAANPEILICDEPTTALDVTIQAQILELINKIKEERHLSVIFITHNLGVVANVADNIAVMYAGKIVEYGSADDIFYDPRHPYTWALLSSMPDLETKEKLEAIPGTPPNMIYPPEGDAFAPRNRYALNVDFELEPPIFQVSPTHYAKTWLCDPRAPKVERPEIVNARIERMKARFGKDIEANFKAEAEAAPDETYAAMSVPMGKQGDNSRKGKE